MTWVTDSPMTVGTRLIVDDAEVTSGTATNTYWRNNSGAIEFLQSDGTSWAATPYDFPCPYVTGVGFANLTTDAPASAEGSIVHYEVTHSVYGVVASGEHLIENAAASSGDGLSIQLVPG